MNKNFIASIIFALGCFIFFVLDVPQYDLLLDAKSALASEQVLLAERKTMSDNFKTLFSQMQQRANDIEKLTVVLPIRPSDDQILSALEQVVAQNGMQLRTVAVSPLKESSVSQYKRVSINIDISGLPVGVPRLLSDLESSLRIYDVAEISISKDSSTSSFFITLKAYAYYSN